MPGIFTFGRRPDNDILRASLHRLTLADRLQNQDWTAQGRPMPRALWRRHTQREAAVHLPAEQQRHNLVELDFGPRFRSGFPFDSPPSLRALLCGRRPRPRLRAQRLSQGHRHQGSYQVL